MNSGSRTKQTTASSGILPDIPIECPTGTDASSSRQSVWIHIRTADRATLEQVRTQVGLPLELLTYCLLTQHGVKVIPCAAWLYTAWQVPVSTPGSAPRAEPCFRLEEIKACVGQHALVTVHHARTRRTGRLVDVLLPEQADAARTASGTLLAMLAERIGDAYLSLHDQLSEQPMHGVRLLSRRTPQARRTARTGLLRHLSAHREAVDTLRACGSRWLDAAATDQLQRLAVRLTTIQSMPSDAPIP